MASPTTSRTLTTSLQRWGEFHTGCYLAHALSNRIARRPHALTCCCRRGHRHTSFLATASGAAARIASPTEACCLCS
jgi:hypothetical protein